MSDFEWGREGGDLVAYHWPTSEMCCGVLGAHDRANHEEWLGPAFEPWPRVEVTTTATTDDMGWLP